MKKYALKLAGFSALILLTMTALNTPEMASYQVDTNSSKVKWTGYHLAKSYEHTGFVNIKEGSITVENGQLTGGNVVIDMTTITNSDLTKQKDNKKLVDHLKSPDFFNVQEHPEATLEISSVSGSGSGLKVSGNITIRGITKPIDFNVSQVSEKNYTANITVNRTEFEVMYGWKLENAILGGDFDLEINLVAL